MNAKQAKGDKVSRGGVLHRTLVPLHLPLLGFLLLFFLCVLYYKFILYFTRGAPYKAVKTKKIMCTVVLSSFVSLSCVSSAIAMYSSERRQ